MNEQRMRQAIDAMDAINREDPNRIMARGEETPKELVHARLVSQWVSRLAPDPSEALRLAARAHHIRRWIIPRDSYPRDRAGYHRWRRALQAMHAEEAARILLAVGYDEPTVARVQCIVRKEGLGSDPEVQTFEDALCLTFFETQLADLANAYDEDKVRPMLARVLAKMSVCARRALEEITIPSELKEVVADGLRGLEAGSEV